jgi:Putative zinc-finger
MTLQRVEKRRHGMLKQSKENFEGGHEYIITSDAECIDPRIRGECVLGYVDGTLTGERLEQFERHLLDCLACDIDVGNMRAVRRLLTRAS